jgi:hypothetical protein
VGEAPETAVLALQRSGLHLGKTAGQTTYRASNWASNGGALEQRVARATEVVLEQRQHVSAVDLLVGLGWLAPSRVEGVLGEFRATM